jgi:hypothetical protein
MYLLAVPVQARDRVRTFGAVFESRSGNRRFHQLQQIGVAFHGLKLGELLLHIFRRVDEKTNVGFGQHGGVIERIARADDVIIQ